MNQPIDCPRFVSEVAHERVVGELNCRVTALRDDVCHWKDATSAAEASVARQREVLKTYSDTNAELNRTIQALTVQIEEMQSKNSGPADTTPAARLSHSEAQVDGLRGVVRALEEQLRSMTTQRDSYVEAYDREWKVSCQLAAVMHGLEESKLVADRAYRDWKLEAEARVRDVEMQRDAYREVAERAAKQRDEFEAAWNGALKEPHRLAQVLLAITSALKHGGAA